MPNIKKSQSKNKPCLRPFNTSKTIVVYKSVNVYPSKKNKKISPLMNSTSSKIISWSMPIKLKPRMIHLCWAWTTSRNGVPRILTLYPRTKIKIPTKIQHLLHLGIWAIEISKSRRFNKKNMRHIGKSSNRILPLNVTQWYIFRIWIPKKNQQDHPTLR